MPKIKLIIILGLFILSTVIIITIQGACGGGGGGGSNSGSSGGAFAIVTGSATNRTQTTVKLNGTVNPGGVSSAIYFQWGTGINYGNTIGYQIVGAGNANLDVFADLTGLVLNTTYNYRMVCSRGEQTINGVNKTFKTRGINTSAPILDAVGNKVISKTALVSFTIFAVDADVEDTLTYSSPDLPAGATLNSVTGAFSWQTPNLDRNYDVTFVVSDDGFPSYSDSETITITVGNVDRPPLLTSPGDKSVDETQLLTFTLSATDPDLDSITYSMTPTLQGVTLNSTSGLFSWTPTYEQSGIYPVTFTATANALSNSKKINITVNNINRPPVLTAIGDKNANEGQLLSFSLSASDPDSNIIAYTMSPTITGAVLNSSTGAFLWTPNYVQAGVYNVTFTATDNGIPNLSDYEAITITVQNMPQPPTVTTNQATSVTGGSAVLNGAVNPNEISTIAYFEYGITNTYGITTTNQALGSGTSEVSVTARITGLSPTITYYFRLVAYSSAGTTNGNGRSFTTTSPPIIAANGYGHNLIIKPDGSLWVFGANTNGQLGLGDSGSTTHRYTAERVGTDTWIAVAAGGNSASAAGYSLGIKSDGTLWGWGINTSGQLGLGNTTSPITTPTQVGVDTNWQRVVGGYGHTLALKTNGTLWAWGLNSAGQCGLGNTTSPVTIPTQVVSDTWRTIAAGGAHSLAIRTDGTLWGWGANNTGQLGRGDTVTPQTTPIQIGSDIWTAIAAGNYSIGTSAHSVGIKNDGTLWSWGYNLSSYNQLGLGAIGTTNVLTPTQVVTPTGTWLSVSAALATTMAFRSDGTFWDCGQNISGDLGRTGDYSILGQVGATADYFSASSGRFHTIAVRFNNSQWELWGFGDGLYGCIDRGATSGGGSSTPVKMDIDISGETGNWVRNITQAVTTSPLSRVGHTMIWDGSKSIMFGGQGTSNYNDLWWYYPLSNTWINNTPTTISPSARNYSGMVWDGTEGVMFGGNDGGYTNDLWWYNPGNNTWTQQIALNTPGSPVSRSQHAMVWDGSKVIMFGGSGGYPNYYNDLWYYYPVTNTWTQQNPVGGPPVTRTGHSMVWDGNKVIMFGGNGGSSPTNLNDLWWYYPITNTWVQQIAANTPGSPISRTGQTMIWDGTNAIMFGGSGSSGNLNDVWSYNPTSNTWTNRNSYLGDVPLPRSGQTMIWDGTRRIMFGGNAVSYRNDLWWYNP
jgi:alpha-tubulin suppressor-like RCC1 family protein